MATPVQDKQTVTPAGESIQLVPAGVTFHDVITQVDERGMVCELFDPRATHLPVCSSAVAGILKARPLISTRDPASLADRRIKLPRSPPKG